MKTFLNLTATAILLIIASIICFELYKCYINNYIQNNLLMSVLGFIGAICCIVSLYTVMISLWKKRTS